MYLLRFIPQAKRDLDHLDEKLFDVVVRAIRSLAGDPRPAGSIKLSGEENGTRLLVRQIRILYQLNDKAKVVTIYRVKHRKEAYR